MRELKQRSWRGTAYWLPSLRVLNQLPSAPEDHLSKDGTSHSRISHHRHQ